MTLKSVLIWIFKTALKVLATIVITFVVIFTLLGLIISLQDAKTLGDNLVLEIRFDQNLYETPVSDIYSSLSLEDKPVGLFSVLNSIEGAKKDPRVNSIFINLDYINLSRAHVEEIVKKLKEFKETKKIYAYGTYINNTNYSLAVIAHEISMPASHSSIFNLTGYNLTVPYVKDLGDKIGIEMEIIHIGEYKLAGENYSLNKMSPQYIREMSRVLDQRLDIFISNISQERNIDKNSFENNLLNGEYAYLSGISAKEKGLVDSLKSDYDLYREFEETYGADYEFVSIGEYLKFNPQAEDFTKDKIAVLIAEGEINHDYPSSFGFSEPVITPGNIKYHIDKILDDSSIKGVVLRINSPGGSALASEIILQELIRLQENLPLVVSMGNVAASGGYYISSNANRIFAQESTITGSIGVVLMFPQIAKLAEKIGVEYETISKGKFSNILNNTKGLSDQERELLKFSMTNTYTEFKQRVSTGRNIPLNSLENLAQGKIYTGEEALNVNLVDEIGGLNNAIKYLGDSLEIEDYQVTYYPREKSFLETLTESGFNLEYISQLAGDRFLRSKLPKDILSSSLLNNLRWANDFGGKPLYMLPVYLE
jgi:protease IV